MNLLFAFGALKKTAGWLLAGACAGLVLFVQPAFAKPAAPPQAVKSYKTSKAPQKAGAHNKHAKTTGQKPGPGRKVSSADEQNPLVFQWEVSHPKNTDQMSVIFKPRYVELVVNASNWQVKQPPRLGRFYSNITPALQKLKQTVETHYLWLQETIPLLSVVNKNLKPGAPRLKAPPVPHAPIIRINNQEMHSKDMYFKNLEKEMHAIWKNNTWACLECASYIKQGGKIVRTVVRLESSGPNTKDLPSPAAKKIQNKKTFSLDELNCRPLSRHNMECIDPQFGIFEL